MRTETLKCGSEYWTKCERHAMKEERYVKTSDSLATSAAREPAREPAILRFGDTNSSKGEDESESSEDVENSE